MIRDGYIASWGGAEYEASPGADSTVRLYATEPVAGFEETQPGRYRRVVAVAEVESLSYVRTICTWRGEPFVIVGEHESWLRVEYTGGLAPVAEALGLDRIDQGVWQTWAPRAEVVDLHEETV